MGMYTDEKNGGVHRKVIRRSAKKPIIGHLTLAEHSHHVLDLHDEQPV
jgi:hypothetical protein